jgi:hypothetical protein
MKPARALNLAIGVIAVALFAESLRLLGLAEIMDGVARMGWGFLAILALSGARDVARAIAWTLAVDGPPRLRFLPAFRARLAGEALNTLLPMGVVVGEPTKASHVGDSLPFGAALRGLAVEFAFYGGSLVPVFAAGVAAFALIHRFNSGVTATIAAAVAIAVMTAAAAALVRRGPLSRAIGRRHLVSIAACEAAYQVCAIAEIYVTLRLISPLPPTIASAVVLETVSRAVTMVFKMVPMRVGVDEASSSFTAQHVNLDPGTGLALAVIRKLRMLFWCAVGLALLARRPTKDAAARVARPSTVFPSAAMLVLLLVAHSAAAQDGGAGVKGVVAIAGPDGAPLVVPGVTVTLRCGDNEPRIEVSNEQGEFRFVEIRTGHDGSGRALAAPTACSIGAELQGFTSATTPLTLSPGETTTANLQLGLDTLREEVTVRASAMATDQDRAPGRVEQVTASIMREAPMAHDRFQDALPLIPGVVRGPDGLLNISGLRSNQSGLTFNNANGTDPVTGEDAVELPIDAVSSVQVRGAAYAPEFGLSAGAVTVVETQKAGDAWDVTVNDLEPRLRRRAGEFRGIESWTPRVTVGGPIAPGKVQLLQSVQYEYSQTRVFGLPPFESDTKLESVESFTRADWVVDRANRFTASTLVSPRKTTYAGLNTFNPQEVTADIQSHNVLASASDQIIAGSGVVETRASVKQFDSTIDPCRGAGPMVLAPDVNSGSYFNDQDRTSRRAEWFTTYSFAPIGPAHVVKAGGGITYETFGGVNTSRPVQIVRADGTLSQTIDFAGGGRLDRDKIAVRGFAQDSWTAGPRLSVLYGARYDYESIAAGFNLAPRGSFSLVASSDGRTVVRGGGGMFYNAVPLNVAAFDQFQTRIVSTFAADVATPLSVAPMANVVDGALRAPRSVTWNLELDREWLAQLFVRVGYQQRENRDEAIVDVTRDAIVLRSDGRSRYREAQVTARYTLHGDDRIVASYTRASSFGNLNDFNGFFGNVENPVIRADERGPLPWDAPNRMLVWSSLSLPRGFAVFPVLDVRSGFPLSNVDADRNFVGPRNLVGRFPTFVSLDAQVTKKLRVLGHNATLGLKVFNITDHANPRDYQGNLASANFGRFDNSVGRTFRGKWIFEF